MNKTFRLGHLRALVVALVAANGALSLAGSYSLDALRGQLDTTQCKACTDVVLTFAECGHWGPGQGRTSCSGTYCLESNVYYSKCTPNAMAGRSDNPCTMAITATAPFRNMVFHVGVNLACNDSQTATPGNPGGLTSISNWPNPSSGDCQCVGAFVPGAANGCGTGQGKCLLLGAAWTACVAGAQVTEVTAGFGYTQSATYPGSITSIPTDFNPNLRRYICAP